MKFKTQQERMQHPQACLIPQSLWSNPVLFNQSLDDNLVPLMIAENEEITAKLGDFLQKPNPFYSRQSAWIAIALTHPQLNFRTLKDIATQLRLSSDNLFQLLAITGNITCLKTFISEQSNSSVLSMIEANNFAAYRLAAENGYLEIAQRILTQSSACFAYAEVHVQEYQHLVEPVMSSILDELHRAALNAPANAVFDINNPEKAKICFYMMRHFIRSNDRELDDSLRFLLSIPSVKALAHREVTDGQSNELIRLALTTNNQDAAAILLTIPEVRQLAEQHNYYRTERQRGFDLGQLARDRESSMTALTEGERKRLEAATKHYQPILEHEGVPKLMNKLRAQLKARYEQNPASFQDELGNTIILPMAFQDLQQLKLSEKDYQNALTAYYQHKDHSAWRYLAIPNPWMNPHASYVYVTADHSGRHSTFEEYQPLITMLWLAATDENMPPIDGMTMEGRLNHFVDELAHIGRAHNWDEKRITQAGNEEEYDDLTGDKPSCFSGVKRRLFQSVMGHPLITILNQDLIQEEIRMFVRNHFASCITPANKATFKEAFEDFVINTTDMSEESKKCLAALNISPEQHHEFEHYLTEKYGEQYSADPGFRKLVTEKLVLRTEQKLPECHYHALALDGLVGFYAMLSQPEPAKASQLGLFSQTQQTPSTKEAENEPTPNPC